ncbi:hypothetical protein D3C76_1659560 [compost metagenome]
MGLEALLFEPAFPFLPLEEDAAAALFDFLLVGAEAAFACCLFGFGEEAGAAFFEACSLPL